MVLEVVSYYGYTLSPNQLETGEGFLICRNVPIARVGDMKYLASELGLPGSEVVTVNRTADEVFSDAALASFEGKPTTDEHPPELLTSDTFALYAKGHAQNVRRGTGEWDGYVVADLHIQDEGLIREIQNGKREVSCGYECDYQKNEDGSYSQHNIRGNHVAIVTAGRAGKKAAILDSKLKEEAKKPERKQGMKKKKNLILELFARAVKDASPEEVEGLAANAAEALGEVKDAAPVTETAPPATNSQDARMNSVLDRMEQFLDSQAKVVEDGEKDPLDQAIESLEGSSTDADPKNDGKSEESVVVSAEEMDEKQPAVPAGDRAVLLSVLKEMRPAIAAIKSDAERKQVTDSLLSCLKSTTQDDISKILSTTQKNAQKAVDSKPAMDLDSCQSAYDKFNPHKNGGNK